MNKYVFNIIRQGQRTSEIMSRTHGKEGVQYRVAFILHFWKTNLGGDISAFAIV